MIPKDPKAGSLTHTAQVNVVHLGSVQGRTVGSRITLLNEQANGRALL